MKILYVEDNDDNVYMLKNRLSRAGFTVVVAADGAQAIAMATSEQPDLILMDLTLPDIRGEEATQQIKADPATKQIPVIALWPMPWRVTGKRRSPQAAMTSIPNRWTCPACSKRSKR
jgi:CheY-like chemotaxis protein